MEEVLHFDAMYWRNVPVHIVGHDEPRVRSVTHWVSRVALLTGRGLTAREGQAIAKLAPQNCVLGDRPLLMGQVVVPDTLLGGPGNV